MKLAQMKIEKHIAAKASVQREARQDKKKWLEKSVCKLKKDLNTKIQSMLSQL